jgi:YHS domain-containing protein
MKPDFIRCEFFRTEIPTEKCELAAHRAVIGGKEYIFCCAQCAQRYVQKKTKKEK